MAFDFVVLGATGIQGRIASRDLLENGYSVLLCGRDRSRITHLLKKYNKTAFEYVDLRNLKSTINIIRKSESDVVLNCAEGDWNLDAMKASMQCNANYLDLGSDVWMVKDQLKLHNILKKKNLISITGCGSTPGVNNVMLAYACQKFDRVHTVEAGYAWTSNMKVFVVPFSIQSIIEEFTAPATIMVNKKFIKVDPMEGFMERDYRGIGRIKSFLVDRHSEPHTFYEFLKNKGIRNIRYYGGFPEHSYRKIIDMIEMGWGSTEKVLVNRMKVVPVNFLTEILKKLEIPKGYKEKENLWVRIEGEKNGKRKIMEMNCIVPTLKGWEDCTCNIDTGMPASIMAQMIKNEVIKRKGSFSPEFVVPPEVFFKELRKRKMIVYENNKRIN